jgi:hypothetical protein
LEVAATRGSPRASALRALARGEHMTQRLNYDESDLREALEEEHPCTDDNSCDIAKAIECRLYLWAANLLQGATESPKTDAEMIVLAEKYGEATIKAEEEKERKLLLKEPHADCAKCGSIVWFDDEETTCDNCLANVRRPCARWIYEDRKDRIKAIMEKIRDACKEAGLVPDAEPFDMSCDEYQWALIVRKEKRPTVDDRDYTDVDYDVTLKVCESEEYDGTENGITFAVDVCTVGGRIVGGLSPYNYSDQCWVSVADADAVEERFAIIENADPADLADLIKNHE